MGARNLTVTGALVLVLAPGCATVTVPMPHFGGESSPAIVQEREALKAATMALDSEAPFESTATERVSFLFFGGGSEAEEEALSVYLADLDEAAPAETVLRDVDSALRRARDVAEMGRKASTALVPTMGDVALLEAAITDVQRCKRRYVGALQMLRERGEPVEKAAIRDVRDAFVQTARDIGSAADMVAARLDDAPDRLAGNDDGASVGF